MKVYAVIAAYNEAEMISLVVNEVKGLVDEVVVVDDGSRDQTGELAAQAGATVLRHLINRGQGAALQTGIVWALDQGAEIIVTFDADGQFAAEEISGVVAPLIAGRADVVLGSRFLNQSREMPAGKFLLLRLATVITNLYTGLKLSDIHNGFRALSRVAAEKIKIRQDGMAHASEILEQIRKHKLNYLEVPVTVKYTEYSKRKGQKISNSLRIVWDLIISRISQ